MIHVGDFFIAGEVVFALVEEFFIARLFGSLSEFAFCFAFDAAVVSFFGGLLSLGASEGAVLDGQDFGQFAGEGFALVAGADLVERFGDAFDRRGVLELCVDGEELTEVSDFIGVFVVDGEGVEEGLEFVHFSGGGGGGRKC